MFPQIARHHAGLADAGGFDDRLNADHPIPAYGGWETYAADYSGDCGLARVPLGRWDTPEEIAKMAVFLASDAAAYVTGETLASWSAESTGVAQPTGSVSPTRKGTCSMPYATTDDGVALHYEETGSGAPVIFAHEFAGDARSWEPQLRHFGRRYRCIAFNARGFPPSDVPENIGSYSQDRAADDIASVLDALGLDRAHIVGLSMGGFATLHFGFRHPTRAVSLCVGGCGYGAELDRRELFRSEADTIATTIRRDGMAAFAERYAQGPTRVQFEGKDPRGFAEFKRMLAEHSAAGSANTQLGVQRERPSLYTLVEEMKRLSVPTLVVMGDEDWPCLQPALLMKQTVLSAALAVIPNAGHAINLEEPDAYNRLLGDFLAQVDAGRWPVRDPRALSTSITGMKS